MGTRLIPIKYHMETKMTIGGLENKMPTSVHGHYIFRNARRAFCFFEMPIATLHFNACWIGKYRPSLIQPRLSPI
jgi:hypothetical protein